MSQVPPAAEAPEGGAGERPPNILVIMTDQQRWDALGCVGGWVETPNMDRLAAEGILFATAYTTSPVCQPARISLAAGRYPHQQREWMEQPLEERQTWMKAIREAGYSTSLIGKTHYHAHSGDLRDREHVVHAYGLDHVDEITGPRAAAVCRSNLTDTWEEAGLWQAYKADLRDRYANKPWVVRPTPIPLELYADVYVGQHAASWLREYRDTKPWFCWVSFGGPHEPWDTPEPYASRYEPADMPEPVLPLPDDHDRPKGHLDERLEKFDYQFEPGDVARLRANYAGNVTLIDDQIGDVLRVVEERGELDDTVVAFVSDHGEMNGDWNLLYKQVFIDGAVRVPFILRLPPRMRKIAGGAVSDSLVELMDLGATLVELAGGRQVPNNLARSVLPLTHDPSLPHREVAMSQLRKRRETMVATADAKMTLNQELQAYLLFDLRADPTETHNLAASPDHQELEQEMMRRLETKLEATR